MIEQHYSADQIAKRLNVDDSSIYRLMNDRKITFVKIGGRNCIPESALHEYINSRTVKAKAK